MKFSNRFEARKHLSDKGMSKNEEAYSLEHDREYWWFNNGADKLFDHSATITKIGNNFHVSDFSE